MTHAVHFFSLVATCLWGAAGHLSWIWTAQRGTSFWDYAAAVNVDKSGNIVVTGDATGSLDNNTFAGSRDVFLMKFNTSGHWHWTRQHGSSASDNARALKSDDEGNIFLAGYTFGSLDQNANVGSSDVFLSKFDNSGKLLWTKARGTSSWDYARALDIDTVGNIFLAGYTGGALDGNTHTGESDFFLMKFSADGGWQWTQQRGSDLYDYAQAVQVDRRGNVLVAGHTMGDLDGHGNAGGKDIFLAMFDKTGDWKWTQQHGGTGDDEAMAMKLDSLGNILIAGETTSSLDGCVHAGSSDMFLMKFAEDGQWQWTQQRGTPRFDAAWALEIDDFDRSVVAGYSGGALDGNQHAGSSDIFVMVFDRSGDWLWTHQRGSEHWDYVRAMQLSGPDVILVGSTQGSLDNASFHGGEDLFVMKLHSD